MNIKNGNLLILLLLLFSVFSLFNVIFINKIEETNKNTNEIKKDIQEKVIPVINEIKTNTDEIKIALNSEAIELGLNKINRRQSNFIQYIFINSESISDYKWTLIAIAWKESRVGEWPVNLSDPSCGFFHNKISNVLKRENIKNTKFNKNLICAKLINDIDFSMKHAIIELDFWNRVHDGNWRKIWGSYNGGYKGNPNYAAEIAQIINIFKQSNINDITANEETSLLVYNTND